MEIPEGKWKHLHKSWEWEQYNRNTAKGMIGEFSQDGRYLRWQSTDGQENLFMEVKDVQCDENKMLIKHRSGLQYWFEKVEETHGTEKRKTNTTTGSLGRGHTAHSNGPRSPKSPSRN